MTAFALIVDHESCWGCRTCEVACKQENDTPDGVRLIRVTEEGPKAAGDELLFRVHVCRHCDDPACVMACPDGAIIKDSNGVVIMESADCTGCQSCIEACPYAAIAFDECAGVAQKCNLCHHRVEKGLIPACADNVCLAHCIIFEVTS